MPTTTVTGMLMRKLLVYLQVSVRISYTAATRKRHSAMSLTSS